MASSILKNLAIVFFMMVTLDTIINKKIINESHQWCLLIMVISALCIFVLDLFLKIYLICQNDGKQ